MNSAMRNTFINVSVAPDENDPTTKSILKYNRVSGATRGDFNYAVEIPTVYTNTFIQMEINVTQSRQLVNVSVGGIPYGIPDTLIPPFAIPRTVYVGGKPSTPISERMFGFIKNVQVGTEYVDTPLVSYTLLE